MIQQELKYSYDDLSIVPAVISKINSRSECNPFYEDNKFSNNKLPLFTAPMESVCDETNYHIFENNGITPIIHRNVPFETRYNLTCNGKWCAYSLTEFKQTFIENISSLLPGKTYNILIDVANGHMQQIFDLVKQAKAYAKEFGCTYVIMTGNIANPDTYLKCCDAGIDYVRCSIGTGSQCLTSANTAIHYPAASLLDNINANKHMLPETHRTKVIADGGMGTAEQAYSRAIIALALGADYVMMGGAFVSFIESAAKFRKIDKIWFSAENHIELALNNSDEVFFNYQNVEIKNELGCPKIAIIPYTTILENQKIAEYLISKYGRNNCLEKYSFGMSSKQAQANNPNFDGKYKTSEGKQIYVPVNYTCKQWVENFTNYLRSAMSYCNSKTLTEFIGNQELVVKSQGTQNSVNR